MADVLIYDGDCGFCSACARWVTARLRIPIPVVPWQEVHDLGVLDLTHADVASAPYYVDPYGRLHRGHDAVAQALRQCRGTWPVVGAVLSTPPGALLGAALYRVVARSRSLLPGGTEACAVPEPRSFTGASANV